MPDDEAFEITPIGLKIVSGPASGQSRTFTDTTVLVGRSRDCSFQVDDPTVSRLHFSVTFVRGRWELTDAGSSSGTAVNGDPPEVGGICVLHDGDRISAGRSVIVVFMESEHSDPSLDADLEPSPEIIVAPPAVIRPVTAAKRGGIRKWLPWVLAALLVAFIAAFIAGSRC